MGDSNFDRRVSNRIYKSSTKFSRDKGNKSPIRLIRKISIIRRGRRFITKISYRSGSKVKKPKRLLQPILFGPQKERRVKTNIKSKTVKQTCQIPALQDANSKVNNTGITTRGLGNKVGFKGRLFSHSNPPKTQKVSQIRNPREVLPVLRSPLRLNFGSTGLHKNNVRSGSPPSQTSDSDIHVSGRLASKVSKPETGRGISFKNSPRDSKIRSDPKLGKILFKPNSRDRLSGHGFQFKRRNGASNTGKILAPVSVHSGLEDHKPDTCKMHSKNSRFDGSVYRHDPVRQVAHAPNTDISIVSLATKYSVNRKVSADKSNFDTTPQLVDKQENVFSRDKSQHSRCSYDIVDRCIPKRMGGTHGDVTSPRSMGCKDSKKQAHKLVRAKSCVPELEAFQRRNTKSSGNVKDRQFHSGLLCKQTGGNPVTRAVRTDMGVTKVVRSPGNNPDSCTHSWEKECHSGQIIKRPSSKAHRVGASSGSDRPNISNMGETPHRSLCNSFEQKTTGILFSGTRLKCGSDRCILNMLGGSSCICVSTDSNDSKVIKQSSKGKLCNDSSGTSLAKTKLVSTAVKTVGRTSIKTASKGRPPVPESRKRLAPRPSSPKPGSMEVVKERRIKKGFSERSAKIMASTRRASTTGTYDSRLNRYYSWCGKRHVDPTTASVTVVADFLQELFDVHKLSPNTVAGYRAAISIVHIGQKGIPLGQNRDLRDLIMGMSQLRPMKKSLLPNWNLPLVLNRLIKEPFEPMQSADIKYITLKTAFLIAIASGRRVSEIHALSIDGAHLRWEKSGVRMRTNPHFMAKNESLKNPGKDIFLAKFDNFTSVEEDKLLCPCRALKIYLKKVAPIRKSHSQLFLTHKKGSVQEASKRTIARWVVETIKLAYKKADQGDLALARAHDTRALSASWALYQGVRLQEVMNAAFWAAETTFTSFYLKDVLSDETAFSLALLKTAKKAM